MIAKTYRNELLTLDFYPKINLTPKQNSRYTMSGLRYRMLTKQYAFGLIGGTILEIMQDAQTRTGLHTWGFLAANLIWERTNANSKRYRVYREILRRVYLREYEVFANRANSTIFVIPIEQLTEIDQIIDDYEKIFAETN